MNLLGIYTVGVTQFLLGRRPILLDIECLRLSSDTFTQCAPEAAEFGEITQNMGHFAVQGGVPLGRSP